MEEVKKMIDQHDAEVSAKAIDEFARQIIELANEFPTVEDDFGELRPMTIEEMCNQVAEQLKAGGKHE